jgi:PEGA domain
VIPESADGGGDMAIRTIGWLAGAGVVAMLSGCVERRFVVETTPPGAKVFVNNKDYGASPATVPFLYYGTYQITLVKDGFQTQIVKQKIEAPGYQYPPIDLFVENFYPVKISDYKYFHYDMAPMVQPNMDELLIRGEELRQRGHELPPPSKPYDPSRPPPPPPPGSPWQNNPAIPTETLPPPLADPLDGNVLPSPNPASPPPPPKSGTSPPPPPPPAGAAPPP